MKWGFTQLILDHALIILMFFAQPFVVMGLMLGLWVALMVILGAMLIQDEFL